MDNGLVAGDNRNLSEHRLKNERRANNQPVVNVQAGGHDLNNVQIYGVDCASFGAPNGAEHVSNICREATFAREVLDLGQNNNWNDERL